MSKYLIKQGQKYSVKVPIPADVQHVFGKKAFKKSLKTSDAVIADARKGPFVVEFKRMIEEARGNPTAHLDDYLQETAQILRNAKTDASVHQDTTAGLEFDLQDRLLASHKVRDLEELPEDARANLLKTYMITTGQLTPFDAPLEDYARSRRVEAKTAAKDRHAITKFAARVTAIQDVDKKAVREFVRHLSEDEGVKNRTIKDNLSTLRTYWKWLQHSALADEDKVNPFEDIKLPEENRKDAAEAVRLPFTTDHIKTLNEAIMASNDQMLQAIFKLAIYTGCRIEELAQLATVNVTDGTIEITRAKTKAGNRIIPVHDKINPLVSELRPLSDNYLLPDLNENRIGVRSSLMSKRFGNLKRRLGFDNRFVFHSLRKTVATQFEQAGVSEGVAADILGHDKPTMTYGVYAGGSSLEQKREAISKLNYKL